MLPVIIEAKISDTLAKKYYNNLYNLLWKFYSEIWPQLYTEKQMDIKSFPFYSFSILLKPQKDLFDFSATGDCWC